MKTRWLRGVAALALAITIALVVWKVANAANICCWWSGDSAIYTYDLSLPGSFKDGTWYGAYVWTEVSTSSWAWINSPDPGNLVKYGSLDGSGDALARTTLWLSGSTITGIEMGAVALIYHGRFVKIILNFLINSTQMGKEIQPL
ncbi:MAG: hypothetical protein H8D32_00335 [Dehalococcoidia bacterium]|nr:hypothetical protein [Dehalococcoidia bacterium]